MKDIKCYSFQIVWATDQEIFIGRCSEFPEIEAFGSSRREAMVAIKERVEHKVNLQSHFFSSSNTPSVNEC
ncbi:hypothetical protein [Zooshikella sp. RANM57]|uniref:hypothetical protein n=1 Tax=Zooshikella sp. RANM57 TaxID=3425863 RepID=UPI003D6EEEC7